MKNCVLYLRSSKDQKDVSIQSQRHELTGIAAGRGLRIVGEYSDVVESGKDWDRPGFQALIKEIRNQGRGWEVVLTKDTSRVARRRTLALIFEEIECAQNGVEVVYANLPDGGDQATVMVMRTVMQAFDEWHSLNSRDKGLAGMAENVRQGYRAAGFAPTGYKLKRHDIGIVRDGAAITKATLDPDPAAAPAVAAYLQLRAKGIPRTQAARAAGVPFKPPSLVGIEWNALTYAGCTTFGVYSQRTSSGAYKGKRKRRPRPEWMVKEETHPALITRDEAETIISKLENSDHSKAIAAGRQGASRYLLTGILMTPAGIAWEGNRGAHYYAPRGNGKGRYVPVQIIEKVVVDRACSALTSHGLAVALVGSAGQGAPDHGDAIKGLQKRIAELARQIDRCATLALELDDPSPFLRKAEALERERRALVAQQGDLQRETDERKAAQALTVPEMQRMLADAADRLMTAPPEQRKLALRAAIQQVVLDPDTLKCEVEYCISAGDSGAFGSVNPINVALLQKRPVYRVLQAVDFEYVDGRTTRFRQRSNP
jgi:site-specific DNA recombinase